MSTAAMQMDGGVPHHSQVTNLQAESGVAPQHYHQAQQAPAPALVPAQQEQYQPQVYGPYSAASAPQQIPQPPQQQQQQQQEQQGQPVYSAGPPSSHTPHGRSPVPSPCQQQPSQSYGPYSSSPQQRSSPMSQGSGYFPQQQQQQQQPYGSPPQAYGTGGGNLHPQHAVDPEYGGRPVRHARNDSHSSTASHRSHRSQYSRQDRLSHGSQGHERPSLGFERSNSGQNERRYSSRDGRPARHQRRDRDDDADSVLSDDSNDDSDDARYRRRHSFGGPPSAYGDDARRRRGSHRSEAEIQRDRRAIDKRPTLGDSMMLMYETLKGAVSGKRS